MKNIDIIAACSDLGVHVNGSQFGPTLLLKNIHSIHQINKIKEIHYTPNFQKEMSKQNKRKNINEINLFNTKLYHEVLHSVQNNALPITLGGDHSIVIASALASIRQYQNMGIIWFDAHGDFNTFETTSTGNIHGLPFACVTGYETKDLHTFHDGNFYAYQNAVLFGAHDIDTPYEIHNLEEAGITVITAEDIKKYGIDSMAKKAFEVASNGTAGIHISYDIDCIDPQLAPGVSVPAANGLNLEEAYTFLDYMIQNKEKIKSLDLVELNPLKDIEHKTEIIASHILNTLIENLIN